MNRKDIERKYVGVKVDPAKFDMSELGESMMPAKGCFTWGYMSSEMIDGEWACAHVKFTVEYGMDDDGRLVRIGEIEKEAYVVVHGDICEKLDVTDEDYKELDDKLSEIVVND